MKLRSLSRRAAPAVAAWCVTMLVGGAGVAHGIHRLLVAESMRESLVRGQGYLFGHAAATAVRRAAVTGQPYATVLEELLEQRRGDGLTCVGLWFEGEQLASAGSHMFPAAPPIADSLDLVGEYVRIAIPFMSPDARGQPHRGGAAWRPAPRAEGSPGVRSRYLVALEFRPTIASDVITGARQGLVLAIVATVALMATVIVATRLTSRAMLVEVDLERQRHMASLGQMAGVLAHEIRNPLASLKGHAQLLLEIDMDQHARASASQVVEAAVRLELLVKALLDYTSATRLHRTETDPGAVLARALTTFPRERLHVTVDSTAARPWSLDEMRFAQVVQNLVRNAIEASPEHGTVDVDLSATADALVLVVRDHGPGLAPGLEDRVFDAFQTTKLHGTGLGLAVARRIVELHGGRIIAESPTGGGAAFRATFPRHPVVGS